MFHRSRFLLRPVLIRADQILLRRRRLCSSAPSSRSIIHLIRSTISTAQKKKKKKRGCLVHQRVNFESKVGTRRRTFADTASNEPSSRSRDSEQDDDSTRRESSAPPSNTPLYSTKKTLSPHRLYRYLKLETFSREEMGRIFDEIQQSSTGTVAADTDTTNTAIIITQESLERFMVQRIVELEKESETVFGGASLDDPATYDANRRKFAAHEATRILQTLVGVKQDDDDDNNNNKIAKKDFVNNLTALASAIDTKRAAPIFFSMLLVGSTVGVVSPAMPFIVSELGLTASQYGAAVSAFALAKMVGNVPAAIAVERHGRKPYMTYSLIAISLGVGGIGMAANFEELYACRLLTGLAVSALSTAATLMVTDLSTPLNRASTYAPIMSAFAAGTALGPALGGVLVDELGLHPTFYAVGVSYLGVACLNKYILNETKAQPIQFPWQKQETDQKESQKSNETLGNVLQGAVGQWVPLLKDSSVRSVMIMNGIYWIALAGSQMTLLPLMLTDATGLAFSATQTGYVYMGMSLVQIFGNPFFARVSDRYGKAPVIVGATTLIGASMACLPYCCGPDSESLLPLAVNLGVWSMGSSMLSTAPLAYISDRVDEQRRAQAIALLRTCGDVGFLIGATATGALADWTGSLDVAMQSSAALLLTATGWFAARQVLTSRLEAAQAAAKNMGTR